MSELNLWDRQPGETAKALRRVSPLPRLAGRRSLRSSSLRVGKRVENSVERWCTSHDWVNRAAEHDSDLASRRRERMAKEMERAQDDMFTLARAALAKVAERIKGMNPEDLAAGQIPAALRTLFELELKALGYEDRVELTGKDGGPVKVETKTQHVFQPSKELWDEVLRKRAEFERLRDGDTDEETASDSL